MASRKKNVDWEDCEDDSSSVRETLYDPVSRPVIQRLGGLNVPVSAFALSFSSNKQVTASVCGFTGIAYILGVHCIAPFEGTDVRKLSRILGSP